MKILITNDDGIQAAGLIPLVKWATKLGQVTVAAPKVEQSGKSHGIEIHKSFEVKKFEILPGVTAYSVDSTPADCVRFAVLGLHQEYDLVISGINRGLNIGTDIMYSGTVAAVFEAENLGLKAMAVSTEPRYYDRGHAHMDQVWQYITEHSLFEKSGIYNINIPAEPGSIRITHQGGPYYSDDFLPEENDMYHPHGKDVFQECGDMNVDTDAVLRGRFISIMPLTTNRTNMRVFELLAKENGQ
jgi:5'-nucleotidase